MSNIFERDSSEVGRNIDPISANKRRHGKRLVTHFGNVLDQDPRGDGRLLGNTLAIFDEEVEHDFIPDLTPTFGVFGHNVKNERNTNRSRHEFVYLDVNNLHEPQTRTAFEADGAYSITQTQQIVDLTGVAPSLAFTLNTLNSQLIPIDQAHGVMIEESVQEWDELTRKIYNDPEFDGSDTIETRQMVDPDTVPPSTDDPGVLSVTMEQINRERSLLIVKRAPSGTSSTLTTDFISADAYGCEAQSVSKLLTLNKDDNGKYYAEFDIANDGALINELLLLKLTTFDDSTSLTFAANSAITAIQASIDANLSSGTLTLSFINNETIRLTSDDAKLLTRRIVQINTSDIGFPEADWKTISQRLEHQGGSKYRYVREYVTSWPTHIEQSEDPETGVKVTIKREIVNSSTNPTIGAGNYRQVRTIKPLDCHKSLKITREIDASILTRTWHEYHNVKYYFPAYLDSETPFNAIQTGNGSVIMVNKASDQNLTIPCRFEITYHETVQVPDEIFQFKTIDINAITEGWSVRESDVITDEGTLSIYIDGQYRVFGIPASSPNATDYLETYMGSEQLIGDECERWKFNLWKRVKIYLRIPDLSRGLDGSLSY